MNMAYKCQLLTSLVTRHMMYYTVTKLYNALLSNIKILNSNMKAIKLPLELPLSSLLLHCRIFLNESP